MASEDQLITEYFMMFDSNGNSTIEAKELKTLLKVVYKQNPDDAMVQQFLQDFDADESGTIDLEEFKKMYRAMPIKPEGESLKDLFTLYDKDGNKDLSLEEVKSFLRDLGDNSSDDLVRKLMDEVDVDRDGRVDFREFCIMYGRTVYGDAY
ncbi:calmodulin-alpha-like [Dreissena polymorpha]|uniref:EF-hand domain-containing protein n=1 Tax=Dreissena polymorpha TaxID=45954 RepID=A0A9D4L5D7_DREPO|nr:calmodulin-alpha-like [Dreissena polymorpha]XP_052275046.1 calmodulin-alpha-like [Dreissena polymorpha]KAH3850917.1 hypothetical protein DPMN_093393 [Dreissena polymorpha]